MSQNDILEIIPSSSTSNNLSSNEDSSIIETTMNLKTNIRSTVWHHFQLIQKEEDGKKSRSACCHHCNKTIRFSSKSNSSTGNLRRHLKNNHLDAYNELLSEEPLVGHDNSWQFSEKHYKEAVCKWVVRSNQPFTEPEQESFMAVVHSLNPIAPKISNDMVKKNILDSFAIHFNQMKEDLQKASSKISFAHDVWTSRNGLAFMAIRAHWISNDWIQKSVLVDFLPLQDNHSGASLCSSFINALDNAAIPISCLMGVTMDNASSNDTFMRNLETFGDQKNVDISSVGNRIRCLDHILNLAVQDLLKSLCLNPWKNYDEHADDPTDEDILDENEQYVEEYIDEDVDQNVEPSINFDEEEEVEISNLSEDNQQPKDIYLVMQRLRILVKKIRKSPILRKKLKIICKSQNIKQLAPIIDVKTRWNSTFKMIERASLLKVPLLMLCSNNRALTSLIINENEWEILNSLTNLLSKFDEATKLLSMDRHPTISSYIPIWNWLFAASNKFIQQNDNDVGLAVKEAVRKMKKYEPQVETCRIPFLATVLNPSLKLSYFQVHNYNARKIRLIKNILEASYEEYHQVQSETLLEEDEIDSDDYLSHLNKRYRKDNPIGEIQKYLSSGLAPKGVDILAWWKLNEEDLPILSRVAKDIYGVWSTSVCVERDFSAGADLVTPTRSSLDEDTSRAVMWLKLFWKSH